MIEIFPLFDEPEGSASRLKKARRRKVSKKEVEQALFYESDLFVEEDFASEEEDLISEDELASSEEEEETFSRTEEDTLGFSAFMHAVNQYKLLSPEEEQAEFKEYKQHPTKERLDKLVCANIRLVISIAKKMSALNAKESMDDMISDGMLGLYKAIEKFEPERGLKFSTYAFPWIKQSINRALANTGDTIRVPVHFTDNLQRIKRFETKYTQTHCCEAASDQAVSDGLDMDIEKVRKYRNVAKVTNSLDSDIATSENASTFKDIIPDLRENTPEDCLMQNARFGVIAAAMKKLLTPRERFIVAHHYAIGNIKPMTIGMIADHLSLTKERIRQIEAEAFKKIKTSGERDELLAFA